MDRKKLSAAENALKEIAKREGKSVAEIRKEIYHAMLVGLSSQNPEVQAYWKRIPCDSAVPTPEEMVVFLADEARKRG
ncbi:MAG: hypothetical protein VB099_04645 [Candidatus Limiplasma sp.]|nr:hypothetical protein [Candidatus Limiplasma sp.]